MQEVSVHSKRTPEPRSQNRRLLRLGFGLVLALLAFSTFQAYRIQATSAEEAVEIYHRHVRQDDLLTQLRRTLWLGANLTRDYLVYPAAATEQFDRELGRLRKESRELLGQLERLPAPREFGTELSAKIEEFWSAIARVPTSTQNFDDAGRYEYIQQEIVPRRNAVGDLVREFTEVTQNALKESEAAFARTRRQFARQLLLVLGLCLVTGILVAIFSVGHAERLERKNRLQYEQVQAAKTELQQLSSRLMDVQEQERLRLSRELHDEIGQMVATFRLELSRAQSLPDDRVHEIRERITSARDLAGKTVQAVRDICLLLRPTMLDDLGLAPALQWHAEDFSRRTAITCDFREKGLSDALPDAVKTCVYRVLQESLHNCEKHAGATRVRVEVGQSADGVVLEIEDNGCGFESEVKGVSVKPARFGILGMRERAAKLGGSLDVRSEPGKGTTVRLCVPSNSSDSVPSNVAVGARAS